MHKYEKKVPKVEMISNNMHITKRKEEKVITDNIKSFKDVDLDFYVCLAANINSVDYKDVTPEMRA